MTNPNDIMKVDTTNEYKSLDEILAALSVDPSELDIEDGYASNAPCDFSGYCAGTSCPYFFKCKGD